MVKRNAKHFTKQRNLMTLKGKRRTKKNPLDSRMLINLFFSLNMALKPVDLSRYPYLMLRPAEKKPVGLVFKDKRKKYLDLDRYQVLALRPQKEAIELFSLMMKQQ